MEPEIIKDKLRSYFEGESSLEDERILHEYFGSEEIDKQFLPFREFFTGLKELKNRPGTIQEEELMDFILEHEHREKIRYRKFWKIVTGVAAMLLIALMAVQYTANRQNWSDTYTDPDQAYDAAVHTLHFVAGKYHEGLAQLEPVSKINQAIRPMTKSINMINKGFEEMRNVGKIAEETERQQVSDTTLKNNL